MYQGERELRLSELGWSKGLLLVGMCRWFGFLGLNHIHCLVLSLLPRWNKSQLPKLEESIHHPRKRVTLYPRKECPLHESVLIQGALLLSPFSGNFLQNGPVSYIQSKLLKFFL